MLNKLLCNVSQEEKEKYKELCKVSKPLFDKLEEIINKELAKNDKISEKDFDCPSWALKRAYKDGYKKGLTFLKDCGII